MDKNWRKKIRPVLGCRWFRVVAPLAFILGVWFWNCLPDPLFQDPVSTVLEDRNQQLLGAVIASDGQWRFPHQAQVPNRFKTAIIAFEDKRFKNHPGIDLLAIGRALVGNISEGRVTSGASTLTMQVIRLSRKNRPRTYLEKTIEVIQALRLEMSLSKDEILALYASNAPFGGNVVGLDAASWRYFGRRPDQLSWAETATLAVLPNNPSLVHPGRNRNVLEKKRNRLLDQLLELGVLDELSCKLARAEALPQKPLPLPALAPHLLGQVNASQETQQGGIRLRSSLDASQQKSATRIMDQYANKLKDNGIFNGAALVLDNATGEVLAYVGNTGSYTSGEKGSAVDIIPAERSTGSLLKPFLYAAMIKDGQLLPDMLQPDIPTRFGSYAPKNFTYKYERAVPADEALARSLNVPAVRMLNQFGAAPFHHLLKKLGMTTLNRSASHYGLSLVLGGAEGSLWEMAGMYAGMARTLTNFEQANGKYYRDDFRPPTFQLNGTPLNRSATPLAPVLNAGSIWHAFEALTMVKRPEAMGLWQYFSSSQKIAWKTGTSFGFRDAWAIGCTPRFTVGVWFGNADGVGRPGLTGVTTAAPAMFDIFGKLPASEAWFSRPEREMTTIEVCAESGYRAGQACEVHEKRRVASTGLKTRTCPYHRIVHLDKTETFQVNADCYSPAAMVHRPWFVLPPGMAWYYKQHHGGYQDLPAFAEDCVQVYSDETVGMELIYPREPTKIYVPMELDGNPGRAIFEVAHRNPEKAVYWHLDTQFLGVTRQTHQMALNPKPGRHNLVLVDEDGLRLEQTFEALSETR